MARLLSLLLSAPLALVGCSDVAPAPAREAGRTVTSLEEIAGPWDIAQFDGYSPTRLHGGIRRAYVDVDRSGLSYVIECNYSGNPAHIDEAGILHDESGGGRTQTLMGCGPEGEAREGAFFSFFASRPKVTWGECGRLIISNGRRVLVLERPEMRRLAHLPTFWEIQGRWVPQTATYLLDHNGYSGSGFQGTTMLTITADRVSFAGCGGVTFRYRYSRDARMVTAAEGEEPRCGQNSAGSALVRVLSKGPLVERMGRGSIALTADREVISLISQAELQWQRDNPPPPPSDVQTPPRPPA